MPNSQLPERASLEYLRKLAKDRLRELRRSDPDAQLAGALLAVARDHGFSSWRELKAEIDRRESNAEATFFDACVAGDVDRVRALVAGQRQLSRATDSRASHPGWTGLHAAAKAGRAEVARLLIEHGADPNAREDGDHTSPLHWAAARAHLDTVRVLLDAGADVYGTGDLHDLDVIGWATFYQSSADDAGVPDASRRDVVALLMERGATHHIFSAMCLGDLAAMRDVAERDPHALDRRLSRFDKGLTPLHLAIQRRRHDMLDLLIELGADLEAVDGNHQTALAMAMLRGDREAMTRLQAAGASMPPNAVPAAFNATMARLADSVSKGVPMIYVPDVAKALEWYTAIGFRELARYEDDGLVNFGMVAFGGAELMINMHGKAGKHDASLWFYTDRIDELYEQLKSRQLDAARASIAGEPGGATAIEFEQEIEDMFYGARQFAIRDLNGYELYFIQSRSA